MSYVGVFLFFVAVFSKQSSAGSLQSSAKSGGGLIAGGIPGAKGCELNPKMEGAARTQGAETALLCETGVC